MPSVIEDRFQELLSSGLNLGQSVGVEVALYDGGNMQVYEFGRIYFHPRIGTPVECHGAILQQYLELSAELGPLGYPITDERNNPAVAGGRMNGFEWGKIQWDAFSGTTVSGDFAEPPFASQVVVKFVDGLSIGLGDGEETDIAGLGLLLGPTAQTPLFAQLVSLLAGAPIRRVFRSMPAVELLALVSVAQTADPSYEPSDFLLFFEIDVPPGIDTEAVATLLGTWFGVVEDAYVSATPSDPAVVGTTNPLFTQQGHLLPGPIGIGVTAAWAKGADGSGIHFIDLERGWFLGHEDLLPNTIRLLAGVNIPDSHGHGTAVLGTVIGRDNNLGGVGIAPGARTDLLSRALPVNLDPKVVADRILTATKILATGDVLLIEVQLDGRVGGIDTHVPVETELHCFNAIRLATAKGIIVIEAAGKVIKRNGGTDVDSWVDKHGSHLLNPSLPGEFKESGAIMVSACMSPLRHPTNPRCNRGSRIDCHAWGDHIVTPGDIKHPDNPFLYFTTPSPDDPYAQFGATSGAAAIIAGVCLLIQHLRSLLTPKDGTTGRLRPEGMRDLLRKKANGTLLDPVGNMIGPIKIGPMPDLAKIVANEFL